MPSLLVVALLVIVSFHGAFGAPSCAKSDSCISKCKQMHGWPGYSMSRNRLGAHSTYTPEPSGVVSSTLNANVVKPTDTSTTSSAPASTPTPLKSVSSASTSGSGDVSSTDINDYLSDHNTLRAAHGAAPLTWNNTLSAYAQNWANGCQFVHSHGPYGENLAAGTGDYSIASATGDWASEASQYNPANPVFSHFTQMVWKATTQVGCAVQSCGGIFPSSYGNAQYYVCEYYPPGNVEGEFAQNVQA